MSLDGYTEQPNTIVFAAQLLIPGCHSRPDMLVEISHVGELDGGMDLEQCKREIHKQIDELLLDGWTSPTGDDQRRCSWGA